MKKQIIVLLIITVTFACKNDKKERQEINDQPEETTESVEKKNEALHITINAVVPVDDTFVLRYTESEDLKFKPKELIRTKVNGNSVAQDIIFKLPPNLLPTQLGMSFGRKNRTGMALNSVIFIMGDKSFEVPNKRVYNYFNPNKYIEFNKEDNTFIGKEIDGKCFPGFHFRKGLIKKLEIEVY